MAGMENNRELSKTKLLKSSSPSTTKSSPIFNRSLTTYPTKSFYSTKIPERNVSKKWYEPSSSSGDGCNSFKGKVKHLRSFFEAPKKSKQTTSFNNVNNDPKVSSLPLSNHRTNRLRSMKSISSDLKDLWSILDASTIRFPGTEDRVVVYYTSLRGVRRTFEDCYNVRLIFLGIKVFVDERDVSMDNGYKKELMGLLGEKDGNNISLPQVFIRGKHAGGIDVIRQLNETGELKKLLHVLPAKDRRFSCESCGDARFLPCSVCCGSRKVFDDDDDVTKRCSECNENGLIRCPQCCI